MSTFLVTVFVLVITQAQLECQNAVMTFERACQLHKGARETISVAEEKLQQNPGMFDAAWQEMLNNANQKVETGFIFLIDSSSGFHKSFGV